MITLRPYQDDALNDVRAALTRNKAVLLQSPTGSGKTALAVTMLGNARQKGLRSFFICHRVELVDQTSRMFDEVGVPHGFIVAGRRPDPYQLVQVCSVDTLRNRLAAIEHPKLCVWDECHHVAAAGWSKILETYKDAYHVGLSATPERLDGRGLGNWFNEIVEGKPVLWLIENNWLCEYKLYDTSHNLNVENLSIKMGDYDKTQLQQTMDKPTITGDAIAHYKRLCNGKRAVIFAVSVMHSKNVVEQFNAAGIVAEHVDGLRRKGNVRQSRPVQTRRNNRLSNVQLIYEALICRTSKLS